MDIKPPLHQQPGDTRTVGGASTPTQPLRAMAPGDIVRATVVDVQGQKLLLEARGALLESQLLHTLKRGDQLMLRVERTAPSPTFTILRQPIEAINPWPAVAKRFLPVQQPLNQSLAPLVAQSAQPPQTAAGGTPITPDTPAARLQTLLNAISQGISSPEALKQGDNLRQALLHLGQFREYFLAVNDATRLQADLKQLLSRVATLIRQQIQQAPQQARGDGNPLPALLLSLADSAEAAGARIWLLQAHNLPQNAQQLDMIWELPIMHQQQIESLVLRIRDQSEGGDASSETPEGGGYRVDIQFHFPETGAMTSTLWYRADGLRMHWTTASSTMARLIREGQATLSDALAANGIDLQHMDVRVGEPVSILPENWPHTRGLLHEKA